MSKPEIVQLEHSLVSPTVYAEKLQLHKAHFYIQSISFLLDPTRDKYSHRLRAFLESQYAWLVKITIGRVSMYLHSRDLQTHLVQMGIVNIQLRGHWYSEDLNQYHRWPS
jgi:hypothetical protein